jgi:hypothetical protein
VLLANLPHSLGMRHLLSVSCVVALASMASGCGGGSSSGGACVGATACGGDIVGTWNITSSCVSLNASMFSTVCPAATSNFSNLSITGTMNFAAALTYTATTSSSGAATVSLPASCLTQQGTSVSCADLNLLFATNPAFSSAECTGTTTCTCSVTFSNQTSTETGTYTTTPAGLLSQVAADTPGSDDSNYCVKGSTLTLVSLPGGAGNTDAAGQSIASGTLVLARQP